MKTEAIYDPAIDSAVLNEAAEWLVRFQSGEAGDEERLAFERWRSQSPAHSAAWRRAELVLGAFGQVPPHIGRDTLKRLSNPGRRKVLGLLLVGAPAAWLAWRRLPWKEWLADLRTATGEQKSFDLVDGTRLVLNTASAVDVAFSTSERRVKLLAGEILVTTGRDLSPDSRPFIVQTPQGSVRALGTRFSVRLFDDSVRVAVFEKSVEVRPVGVGAILLHAGHQTIFRSTEVQVPQPVDAAAALWEQGMLVARNMRLADLAAELARYRIGVIRCHTDVADMPVSGAFPLSNTDASLTLLEKTLPLRVSIMSRYWVIIEPRRSP